MTEEEAQDQWEAAKKEQNRGKGQDHPVHQNQEVDQDYPEDQTQEDQKNDVKIHVAGAAVKKRKKDQHQEVERDQRTITRQTVKADDHEAEKDPVQVKIPVLKLIKLNEKRKIYQNKRRKIRKRK